MRTILVYPIPFNVWGQYSAYVKRFTDTFKEFPPCADYELWATCHWGEPTDEVRQWFYGIKTKFVPYYANGCQVGAQQQVASTRENDFIIGITSHAYFFRAGWLDRFMKVREQYGPGLYGTCGSQEGKLHMRTNFYGLDAEFWHAYPHEIETREDCSKFECGEWSLWDWFWDHMPHFFNGVVYWDSVDPVEHQLVNGYRDGNQEQLLVWDRHTDIWQNAQNQEKRRLADLAKGIGVATPSDER